MSGRPAPSSCSCSGSVADVPPRDRAAALDAAAVPADRWEGRSVEDWRALWKIPALHLYVRVGSTNDVAKRLAEDGAATGTVVMAEEQVAGRGRGGRRWISEPGASLAISIVVRTNGASGRDPAIAVLPLRVGLAVARAIDSLTGVRTMIKWPNDVQLAGRKVCGILCEGAFGPDGGYVVAGIGVNVAQGDDHWPPDMRDAATSVQAATGVPIWRPALAGAIIAGVLDAVRLRGPRLDSEELAELRERDALHGRTVQVDGSITGVACGIAEDGSLCIRDPRGDLASVRSGTVRVVEQGDRKAFP